MFKKTQLAILPVLASSHAYLIKSDFTIENKQKFSSQQNTLAKSEQAGPSNCFT